uniref:Uncharacterized protein n=1 Tax=Oryza sativa subsp. japonica TaxID=39947 RepID=Q5VMY7_ORYSJ|nr:hypothetical protein [Oryza sativa Japonica Group]BAD69188.1 hypothetical protein [Oryza sativa Japonica Group]
MTKLRINGSRVGIAEEAWFDEDDGVVDPVNSSVVVNDNDEMAVELGAIAVVDASLRGNMSCIVLVMTIVSRYFDGAKMQYLLEMLEER